MPDRFNQRALAVSDLIRTVPNPFLFLALSNYCVTPFSQLQIYLYLKDKNMSGRAQSSSDDDPSFSAEWATPGESGQSPADVQIRNARTTEA